MSTIPTQRTPNGTALLVAVALILVGAAAAVAQPAQGEPEDLAFRVVNMSTGEPGTLERLTISYIMVMPEVVIDTRPEGSSFVVRDVPIKEEGRYIIEAWARGVPYYSSLKGRDLMAEEQELQVFDITGDLASARITGLNVVVEREGELVHLEYLLQVSNDSRPALTIFDAEATFTLDLPGNASDVVAEYRRGPSPTAVPVARAGGDEWQLGIPLTPGNNRIRVTAMVPWLDGLELPVGADLAVEAWSMLVTPDWLEVDNRQLEPDPDVVGLKRLIGPPLDAGETLRVRLGTGRDQPAPVENVFSDEAPEAETGAAPEAEAEGSGLSRSVLISGGMLVILLAVILYRRRS